MNQQIIAQFENLLNPAAKAYLMRIVSGDVPLVLGEGVSPIPDGLNSRQMRVVHQIAQANNAEDLNLPGIINSGVLRSRGGGGNAPQSQAELYNLLYNVTSGATTGPIGPPDSTRIEEEISQARASEPSPAVSATPGTSGQAPASSPSGPSSFVAGKSANALSGTEFGLVSKYLNSVAVEYLRTGEYDTVTTLGGESLTPSQRNALDAFRVDPSNVDAGNFAGMLRTGYTVADLNAVLEPMRYARAGAAGDVTRAMESAQVPSPDRPPLGPLPENQEYRFDYSRNQWMVVENGTKFVTFVNLEGAPERAAEPVAEAPVTEEPSDAEPSGLVSSVRISPGTEDIEPGELSRPTVTPPVETDAGGEGDGVSDGVLIETPYADAVPEDWELAASEIYGAYFHIIKQDPQVAELIAQAAFEEWEPDKFQYQLEQTNWWRTTSEAVRKFDNLYARDPATAQADIDRYAQELKQDALDLNIRLTGEQLNQLAYDAIRGGMTKQQVTNALGMLATSSAEGVTSLRYGYYGNTINQLASNYGVSISDDEFNQLVDRFAVGQENEESLTSSFQAKATALFPALSERLMAGETFSQIVEPYRYRASQILGRDFASTDFMDNDSFSQAVTYVGDDGKERPMTYTEWGQYLRSNREFGYEFTDEAQSRAYMVANRIADIFGAV
jgi:hypothetical protein